MRRPAVKIAHRPVRRPDGTIWIGSLQYGLGVELEDGSGLVWPVCVRMDGSLTRDELVAAVADDCSADVSQVEQVVDFLIESGWVEDAAAGRPAALTRRDTERYERGIQFFSWVDTTVRQGRHDLQARLKTSKVTVIGVGGIGCAAAASLAASGVGLIRCVDKDTVELSNLNRQLLYGEADLGLPKAEVAAARLRGLNSDIEVVGTVREIRGQSDFESVAAGSDVFVLGADSPAEVEVWASRAALKLGIPWLNGSYAGPMMAVGTFIPGMTGCFECMTMGEAERLRDCGRSDLIHPLPVPPGWNPIIAPTAQMAGNLAALEVLNLLLGLRVQTAGRTLYRSFIDYDHQFYIDAKPRPDCPACGRLQAPGDPGREPAEAAGERRG
jgi:molybdopterin/thiamine biosynthesis adenylyltransferase